jgi:hypothetical protein
VEEKERLSPEVLKKQVTQVQQVPRAEIQANLAPRNGKNELTGFKPLVFKKIS